jgi:competence protein ComEC
LLGLLATTLVAGLATAPFASYHFQAANPYGILGNALALPLVSLVVMPAAVLGMLAYPFGLDRPVWDLMGLAVDGVLRSAAAVAELDGASLVVAAYGPGALGLMSAGLIVVVLVGSPLRWLGLAPALGGLWLSGIPDRPDLFVDREGAGAAIRAADGRLAMVGRSSAFVAEQWLRADGDARTPDDASLRAGARCDPLGCVVPLPDGRAVAYVADRRAFAEDCRRAAILVTRLRAPLGCAAPVVIDRAHLERHGATSLTLRDGTPDLESVRDPSRPKPWLAAGPPAPTAARSATASPPPTRAEPDASRGPPVSGAGPQSTTPGTTLPTPAPLDDEAEAWLGEQ